MADPDSTCRPPTGLPTAHSASTPKCLLPTPPEQPDLASMNLLVEQINSMNCLLDHRLDQTSSPADCREGTNMLSAVSATLQG